MTYNADSNVTSGLVYATKTGPDRQDIISRTSEMADLACHPMLVPVLVAQATVEAAEANLRVCANDIKHTEYETGQSILLCHEMTDPLSIDFLPLTRKLNRVDSVAGRIEVCTDSISVFLDSMADCFNHISKVTSPACPQHSEPQSELLKQQIAWLQSQSAVIRNRARYARTTTATQRSLISLCKPPIPASTTAKCLPV
jgi:hypothetical protein